MSRKPPDELAQIAIQMAKALEAVATVTHISQMLVESMATNAATITKLDTVVAELKQTVNSIELLLYKAGDTALIITISNLRKTVEALERDVNSLKDQDTVEKTTHATGKWNVRVALVNGLFMLLGSGIGAFLTILIWKLTGK